MLILFFRVYHTMLYQQATFIKSAAKLEQLPEDTGYEVAFAGRSNAGKSTALNILTSQKHLAKTSKTPGRTQLINLFKLDEERRLVDLPGYGFAKVPQEVKLRWQQTLGHYLQARKCLKGIVLLMDCRHPFKPEDVQIINWAVESQLPCHILLSKADKLKYQGQVLTLRQAKQHLLEVKDLVSIQLFSALKRQGIETFVQKLNSWYGAVEG